jgi:hypothetical protein
MNGSSAQAALASITQPLPPSQSGFVAVNARPHADQNGNGASQTTRHDLMSKFHTLSDRRASSQPTNGSSADARRPSVGGHTPSLPATPVGMTSKPSTKPPEQIPSNLQRPPHYSDSELHTMMNSPVPIPNTPSSLLPAASQRAQQPQEKDDGGPFKTEMVHRMESLSKGERILPPCDRCRRLHMDCLKNLTACMGCTKKHAKCSWKEVRENELRGNYQHIVTSSSNMHSDGEGNETPERQSTGSPGLTAVSPARQGLTPNPGAISNSSNQHAMNRDARMMSNRQSPNSERDRDRDRDRESRGVETQLQEAAKSAQGIAHASARMGNTNEQSKEFQAMVA